jgi:hypothetical protein
MLNKTLEFLRIADLQPSHEKVKKRSESAKELTRLISKREHRDLLLACIQGIVVGFDGPLFKQESIAVGQIYKAINDRDATLPFDLKENALELRAVAGIAVGELLTTHASPQNTPAGDADLAAMSLSASLGSRPDATDKHIRWMLETVHNAAVNVLRSAAGARRKRSTDAFETLADLQQPAEVTDLWNEIMPAIKSAIQEVREQEAINREELETLWWMFAAFSESEGKPLADLGALGAALIAGIELAQRVLLPPSASSAAMIKRAVEFGRKPEDFVAKKLQDAAGSWSDAMSNSFSTENGDTDALVASYPALLPLTATCKWIRADGNRPKTVKEIKALTGLALTHQQTPTEWGLQMFREKVLQRRLADNEEK